ncbi:MAG TPA: hypothetical protein VGJ13_05385 [Pseudonocardiaceae bacterium]|jgi:hypothetical protein
MTADKHVEHQIVPGRRLGRRPHDPNRPALRLGPLLTGVIPDHPATVDHFSQVGDWGMLKNDVAGDCGPAMVFHDRILISRYLAGQTLAPDDNAVIDLYRRSGNPNYPADDNGVVLADMLKEVETNGIAGTRCLAYAQVDVTNLDEIKAAVAIFGSVHLGVDLHVAQQAQTDQGGPWDYDPSAADWGGHAILGGLYALAVPTPHQSDVNVITWGEVMGVTDEFWQSGQVQEAWVVIWPEHLGSTAFVEGVDQAALAADFKALTGRDFPVGPNPQPGPTPVPPGPTPGPAPAPVPVVDPADQQLADATQTWLTYRHHGMDAHVVAALKAWKAAKGL